VQPGFDVYLPDFWLPTEIKIFADFDHFSPKCWKNFDLLKPNAITFLEKMAVFLVEIDYFFTIFSTKIF
jgi:hypothetical protein